MNNTIKNLFIFAVGAAIGSAVTLKLVKSKFEKIAQEEIDSVKEVFSKHRDDNKPLDSDEEISNKEEEADVEEYQNVVRNLNYTSYSNRKNKREEEHKKMKIDRPYVIPPEEFGEKDGYECISLNYYADCILTDDNDDIMEEVEDVVGFDSLNHFGEYEDDSVFVRNNRLKCDFEILKDLRRYSDVAKTKPRSSR